MNGLCDSGSTKSSITSTPCSINGTARMESSSRFERTTEISIFFDNRHRALMAPGILFHFAKRTDDRMLASPGAELRAMLVFRKKPGSSRRRLLLPRSEP